MEKKNIVAAGDIKTAEAVKEVLLKGGNAFDGALAGVFAAYMAEPALTSPAGGGFLMAFNPYTDEEPLLYDFFVETPPLRLKDPEFFAVEVDFGDATQIFHIGAGSVAIPGTVAGLLRVHSERGRLPLKEVLKPALRYAKEGIYLSPLQAGFIKLLEPIFTATEEARKIFAPEGDLINDKKLFKNPDYALFLEKIADQGSWVFYEGEIAEATHHLMVQHRGLLRKEDLARYRVVERKPIKISFEGYEIYLNPPPSAGGILIAFTLKLLEGQDLDPWGSEVYIKNLIEAFYTTNLFRKDYIDGKLHSEGLEKILQEEKIIQTFKAIFKKRLNLWGNTTHLSISDAEGNVVSVTTTNGEGSGYVIPGYGVMLNNMLGEEDLNPRGFFKWDKPYQRLPSMMCPTVVLKDGEVIAALGSAGSNRIRSAIVQVLLNLLHFHFHPQEAVDKPRLHVEGNTVYLEPPLGEKFKSLIEGLYKVQPFKEKSMFFGGVQVVAPPQGEGGADPRRGGVVLVFP
ncbi:MAG: gamma-glutamyltransferase [Aquificota bacterium]